MTGSAEEPDRGGTSTRHRTEPANGTQAGAQGALFTPGPWSVVTRGERGTFHIPEARQHEAKVADSDGVDGYTVSKANANLIAAAPHMYAALHVINELLVESHLSSHAMTVCRTALRKAHGK